MNPSLKLFSRLIIPIAKLALHLSCLGHKQMNPSLRLFSQPIIPNAELALRLSCLGHKPFSQLIDPTIQLTFQPINKSSCLNRMSAIHKHRLSDQLIRRQTCRFYMLIDSNLRLPVRQSKLSSCPDRRPIDPNPKLSSRLINPIIRLA